MSSDAAAGESVRGIGARLRAAREQRGLTLLQAAEKLHVDTRVLEALESEDFAALGAVVYVRGHLRRYAELTGESPEQLQELYAATAQPIRPDLTRIPRSTESRERSSPLMLPVLLLVVGVALAGAVWWVLKLPGEKAQAVPANFTAPLASGESQPAAGAAPETAPAGATGAAAQPSGDAGAALSAGQARLNLSFSAPSWVEISDADGHHLLEGLMAAGSSRTLAGSVPLRVTLGNAPAVSVQLNGQSVPLAGLARRDGSAHLLIDGRGRASLAAARLAHGD